MIQTQKIEKTLRKYGLYDKAKQEGRQEEARQLLNYINSGLSMEELKAKLQQHEAVELAVTE